MTALTIYGSSVADTTLTTACDMAQAVGGGTETSKTTTLTGTEVYGEVFSQGGTAASVATLPATPTGHGWVYTPGVGTYVEGNWSALITLSAASWGGSSVHGTITARFFHYSGGAYTAIGQITTALNGTSKMTYSLPATSMPSITFGFNDLLYVDLWWFDDATNAGGDNPVLYVSTSATQGVAGDMQISTPGFASTAMLGYDPVGHQGVPIQVQDVQTDEVTGQQYGSVIPQNTEIESLLTATSDATSSFSSTEQINRSYRGVKIIVTSTIFDTSNNIYIEVQANVQTSGFDGYSIARLPITTSNDFHVLTIYPGVSNNLTVDNTTNMACPDALPLRWRAVYINTTGTPNTFTVWASMIV